MENDRSLSSGMSIPQWMKTRMIDNRLDLEQNSFSPPNQDDSFLYIRYARRKSRNEDAAPAKASDVVIANADKHLAPCRPFITGNAQSGGKQLKSNGTDDGFKGAAAACGTSIVKVAQEIISKQQPALCRRGSKSLPVSPELPRRHKYFTAAFHAMDDDDKTGVFTKLLLRKRESISNSGSDLSKAELREMNFWSPTSM